VSNNEFDCPLNEPWLSFLAMLDQKLSGPTTLICMGGFAMTHRYGSPSQTHDFDVCDHLVRLHILPTFNFNSAEEKSSHGSAKSCDG